MSSPLTKLDPAVAPSALAVPHSRIRELAEIAMSMEGVLKLYFGESSLPTPEFIKRAAQKAMADGYTFYTENAGLPSLRKALARYYRELHAVEIDAAGEIVVTASGVQALHLAVRCLLDPGDEALVLTPAWPNGAANVAMANAVPVEIAQPLVGDRYRIDFSALKAAVTPRTRMLLYTSPSNPLGWVATVDEQRQLLEFARHHGLWLMADEVYERLNYTGPKTMLELGAGFHNNARADDPKASHTRRRRRGCAVVFESVLHDGLAAGMAGGAARPGGASHATERVRGVARAQFYAARRRDRAAVGRKYIGGNAGAIARESRLLPGCSGEDAGRHRSQAGRRVLFISPYRGGRRLLRFLQTAAARNSRGTCARRCIRRRR